MYRACVGNLVVLLAAYTNYASVIAENEMGHNGMLLAHADFVLKSRRPHASFSLTRPWRIVICRFRFVGFMHFLARESR